MRVLHCPVNTAGIPWANSQALRRRGIESSLLVFNRYKLHPEADISLDRTGGLLRQQATQWRAFIGKSRVVGTAPGLAEVVAVLVTLLKPVLMGDGEDAASARVWRPEPGRWM